MDNFFLDYLKALLEKWYITLPLILLSLVGLGWQVHDIIIPFVQQHVEDIILLILILITTITLFIPYLS